MSSTEHRRYFGVDVLAENPSILAEVGRIGIVSNQACSSIAIVPSTDVVFAAAAKTASAKVTCVFGPQHGYHLTEQDNMIETPDTTYTWVDPEGKLGSVSVPLFSLYSESREPTEDQMRLVDTFVVDVQDIGCRVYTFMYTLALILRAANKHGKKVIVLDRPNPLGLSHLRQPSVGDSKESRQAAPLWLNVCGDVMNADTRSSFVGWYDLPLQHGLTLGELGYLFMDRDQISPEKISYTVVKVPELQRTDAVSEIHRGYYDESVYPFFPSPNMNSPGCTRVFICGVMLEGTNISEGRGTTKPFFIFGAPWIDNTKLVRFIDELRFTFGAEPQSSVKGVRLLPYRFRPTFNKHQGQICFGAHLHVPAHEDPNLFALGLSVLLFCALHHPRHFAWRLPSQGYEYNFKDYAINLILGTDRWKRFIDEVKDRALALDETKSDDSATDSATDSASSGTQASLTSSAAECKSQEELSKWAVGRLQSMLQESHKQAQQFAQSSQQFFLY